MNIFATDPDPAVSAKALDDKRVNKMILETAQMICTVLHKYGIDTPYKPTHENHPCTLWMGESKENFKWALKHLFALNREFVLRFNKNANHASYTAINMIQINGAHIDLLPDKPFTPPPLVGTYPFKFNNVYESYKYILKMKWISDVIPPKWSNTSAPAWYLP